MASPDTSDFAARFERLYVPAVADVLDRMGLWNQLLKSDKVPLSLNHCIAGPAFTAKGHATIDVHGAPGSRVLAELPQGSVAVWDTGGDLVTGHWGELMSNTAIARGCRGAIVDGGIRDTPRIVELGFPVWYKYRSPADARGRWTLTEHNVPVMIDGVFISPGDYVFADADGVVVIPVALVEEVLLMAEKIARDETTIREAVRGGAPLYELYERYKTLERPSRVPTHKVAEPVAPGRDLSSTDPHPDKEGRTEN